MLRSRRDDDGDDSCCRSSSMLLTAAVGAGLFLAARAAVRNHRWYDVSGKTVLITGGSRGFGLLMAREYGALGARVAICARDPQELDRATADLRGRGVDCFAVTCDLTNEDDVRRMVADVAAHFGPVDVLVNNAGTIAVGPMEVMTLEDYREAMNLHFWAPLHTTLAVLPAMRTRGGGRIVNISSIGGKIAAPHLLPYSASKFALTGLSQGLRAELVKDNVYVTTVCPGLIRTGSPRNAWFKGQHRAEYAWFALSDSIPLTSMNAARGAARVVLASQRGEAELILSIQAKLAVKFHSLFTGISTDINAIINRLLPGPGGIGSRRARGEESESAVTRSPLTALTQDAARANNQMR